LVDAEDLPLVSGYRWNLHSAGYVQTDRSNLLGGGSIRMHRLIMGAQPGDGTVVDHRNWDPLDNRRGNLRVTDTYGNAANLRGATNRPGRSSRHRGVCWHKPTSKWMAYAKVHGRQHYLGYFADEDQAAQAASAFRREHMPTSEADLVVA